MGALPEERERIRQLILPMCLSANKEAAMTFGGLFGRTDVAKLKAAGNVKRLIRALQDNQTRGAAIEALGDIGDKRAVPMLHELLQQSNPWLRLKATRALGKIRDKSSAGPLIHALRAAGPLSTEQHRAAAESLGELRDSGTVDLLVAALGDSSSEVRSGAIYALGAIGDRRALDPLIAVLEKGSAYGERRAALEAIVRIDNNAIPTIGRALRDKDSDVRMKAVEILSSLEISIKDSAASEALISALKDADAQVRAAALEGLIAHRWPGVEAHLLAALDDPDGSVRVEAVVALEQIHGPQWRPEDPRQKVLVAIDWGRWQELASYTADELEPLMWALPRNPEAARLVGNIGARGSMALLLRWMQNVSAADLMTDIVRAMEVALSNHPDVVPDEDLRVAADVFDRKCYPPTDYDGPLDLKMQTISTATLRQLAKAELKRRGLRA